MDGGYIIRGITVSEVMLVDVYLVKTDAKGNTQWIKTYGDKFIDVGYAVCETKDGGYIIAGITNFFVGQPADAWLIRTNKNGDTLWTKTFGGPATDIADDVSKTQDDGYIIVGETASFGAGAADLWLIKTKPDVVGIEEGDERLDIGALKLEAYPNPFTQKTVIRLLLSGSSQGPVQIKIYDKVGKLVKTLESASRKSGYCTIEWDGTDNNNKKVAPGVYFAQVLTDKSIVTKKLIKLR